MKYIFIDTNIFLHFEDLEEINWIKDFELDECTLVIAPIIIDELDEKKLGNSKIAKRARKALHKIEEYSGSEKVKINSKVLVKILNDKPKTEFYDENELNFKEQDHRLLASMIKFRSDFKKENIAICTNDVGPRIRARGFNFQSFKPNEKYLLPFEDDLKEKEINKLKLELSTIKSKNPILDLKFNNGKNHLRIKQKECSIKPIKLFDDKMKKFKEEFPPVDLETMLPDTERKNISEFNKPSIGQFSEYNQKLEKFNEEYEESLKAQIIFDYREELTYTIKLSLENSGKLPAENIDIHLHFPDGFELINASDKPTREKLPKPPKKPKTRFDYEPLNIHSLLANIPSHQTSNIHIGNLGPDIKKTNSYDVNYNVDYLKHSYQRKLDDLLITFDSPEDVKSFGVEFIISAGNMTEQVSGTLNVILEK